MIAYDRCYRCIHDHCVGLCRGYVTADVVLGVLDQAFEANELVMLDILKGKGVLPKKTGRMKILAAGVLNKPLTVKAEGYSIQAIKMIELTGGTVIILKD